MTIQLGSGEWRTTGVDGAISAVERERLLAVRVPEKAERPHWEFLSVTVRGRFVDALNLWVGPIPYEGPGTVCQLKGTQLPEDSFFTKPFYKATPREEWERTGALSLSLPSPPPDEKDLTFECHSLKGHGWQAVGEVRFEASRDPLHSNDDVIKVISEIRWSGEPAEGAESMCVAELTSSSGEVVGRKVQRTIATGSPRFGSGPPAVEFLLKVDDPMTVTAASVNCRPA